MHEEPHLYRGLNNDPMNDLRGQVRHLSSCEEEPGNDVLNDIRGHVRHLSNCEREARKRRSE